ncbi:MAG: hemolysin family protein, partial [Candidatus Neomarinimicrobiota bacterium]|nr:hemolysin family protein [Candidatus Neomarinimicrobiota bacterium]
MILIIRKTGWINISENIRSSKQELEEKRDDIQHAYEQVDDPKAMEQEQKEMISNVFDFRESTAYAAMTPRTEISAVSNTDSLEKVLHVFIDSGHSKLPVYENDLDNIIGIIYLYDLFHAPKNITDVIKPVLHVPYSKPTMDLMLEFQSAHHALAIVLDEHGGSAGIITAEDLFEELFGEFEDEFDENTEKGSKLNDGSILVNARMDWKEFNNKFNKIIPEGEYETIGGYIISELGRIPNKGEHLFMSIGQIIIQEATARQIHQVKIYPKEINSSE